MRHQARPANGRSALQVHCPCTATKRGGESRPESPHLGPRRRGHAPGAGRAFPEAPPLPALPRRPRRLRWPRSHRKEPGRLREVASTGGGDPEDCGAERFSGLVDPTPPLSEARGLRKGLWRGGRRPPMAALAGPVVKALEVRASLPGGARGLRAPGLSAGCWAPGAGPLQRPVSGAGGWRARGRAGAERPRRFPELGALQG